MELNEKLQELRKNRNLTQEQLAEKLFISRTAVSKWESGRGYPSIDSLKDISKFFEISLDDLLSKDELLDVASEDGKQKVSHFYDMIFGLLDCFIIIFLFFPFFGEKTDNFVKSVPLISLMGEPIYIIIPYYIVIFSLIIFGITTLTLQNNTSRFWINSKRTVSILLSTLGIIVFTVTLQPYPAILMLIFLVIKTVMIIKFR